MVLPAVFFGLMLVASAVRGQDEDEDPYLPGLIGRYESSEGTNLERIDRAIAFNWSHVTPDRRLNAKEFHVQWRGRLQSQANGLYRIHAHFSGRLKVTLNGQTVLDAASQQPMWHSSPAIELPFDHHSLAVTFEKTGEPARVALFWSGPQFQLEPIDGRQLFHDRGATPDAAFERGESLVRALRCAACHEIAGEPPPIPAPSLERLAGNMNRAWLQNWLTAPLLTGESSSSNLTRRMPHFGLKSDEAQEIAAWLFAKSLPVVPAAPKSKKSEPKPGKAKSKKNTDEPEPPVKTPVEAGRELLLTVGCLACHQLGELGSRGLYDGGDLSAIAAKRTPSFFDRWLVSPEASNPDHRMPVFELTELERSQLTAFLLTLGAAKQPATTTRELAATESAQKAIAMHRCAACHAIPGGANDTAANKTRLTAQSNWSRSCAGESQYDRQPHFALPAADRIAVRTFVVKALDSPHPTVATGRQLLTETNCLACHQRNDSPGLAPRLTQLGALHPDLATQIPAMTPPALNSVGDKLHDGALRAAITRRGAPHRPYLMVRMPRFKLNEVETQTLVDHFQSNDRIPVNPPLAKGSESAAIEPALLEAVGSRLVTPDGFGCTSCHQVGKVFPVKAPQNARGPDLSMLGSRVRREWYDRFVRNPSRIVPRMEMPSVQIAVRGVLPENIDQQLDAVWDVLNKPGFQPPESNPVQVVRHSGTHPADRAIVITDVLRTGSATYIKPLLIGLSNRHNMLFDLETARLRSWSIGDTARQRTEGKAWFWEAGGHELFRPDWDVPEISLERAGPDEVPRVVGQFATEFDSLEHIGNGIRVRYRLRFGESAHSVRVTQTLTPVVQSSSSGFRRMIEVADLPQGERVRLAVFSEKAFASGKLSADSRTLINSNPAPVTVSLRQPTSAVLQPIGVLSEVDATGIAKIELEYATSLPGDRFLVEMSSPSPPKPESLRVVPGFDAIRLPLTDEIMPTALGWRPDGTLVIASLKGQVWQARDTNGDGLADQLQPLSGDLAAPYGMFVTADYVDVVNKYAVVRLFDDDRDGRADRTVTVASGWAHTADYHDWVVGLPRDDVGNYYVALPCQQDQRSLAGSKLRGEFLKLVPREPTPENPSLYSLETISRGHRFPMGIARRRDGELFVTDNQGNYNPFNELNHVRPGAHFGFINAVEKGGDRRPPLTPPAINLPHPWTRSVNGICFLETPQTVRRKLQHDLFGPFEGHLIGCEYDTRRLIRMSLQKVRDKYQGGAYPFSYDQPLEGPPFLGPLVCQVAPDGDLYVGGLRDSGWGGANNIGEVVRLRIQPDQLPCGIAEMRATYDGFEINFTAEVDRKLAEELNNYSLASYTRESTPAYGGPDLNYRTEQVKQVQVSADGRRVTLRLAELRVGYVYELHIKPLITGKLEFFPAEAHFTLWEIPSRQVP